MKTIYGLLLVVVSLVVGTNADLHRAQAESAVGIAYAAIHKVRKAEAKCDCKDCKCVDCKCENCGKECKCLVTAKPVWKFFRDGKAGEWRLLDGDKVSQVKKFVLTPVYGKSCNGRTCTQIVVGHKWVETK